MIICAVHVDLERLSIYKIFMAVATVTIIILGGTYGDRDEEAGPRTMLSLYEIFSLSPRSRQSRFSLAKALACVFAPVSFA